MTKTVKIPKFYGNFMKMRPNMTNATLRSQETLKFSHLKNVAFILYIVEISFGNAYTKF